MAIQIQIRRDTATNWTSENPILADGEIGYETDTQQFKVGNGSDDWNTLPYVATGVENHSELNLDDGTNPHGTTKADVGLSDVPNLDTTDAVANEHTHPNKALLDTYTQTETDLANAVSKAHDPATAGDGISVDGQEITNTDRGSSAVSVHENTYVHGDIALNTAERHTHANKTTLDAIQEALTTALKGNYDDAYTHSTLTTGNPHNVTKDDVGLSNVPNLDTTDAVNKAHDPVTAGDGIEVTGQEVSNTDRGSTAVTAHEATYQHNDIALNTADRHSHDNKALLDTYTQTEADLADAVDKRHDIATAGTGISIIGQEITNSDTGSGAVSTHETTYTHSDIALNTASRHNALTLGTNTANALSLDGQELSLADVFVKKSGDTMTGTLNLPSNGLVVGTDQLVASGGDVGIGTTSPAYRLDVVTPDAIAARFSGRVSGADAVNADEFTTLGQLSTQLLPSGTSGQTLRHDGTAWIANSLLYNDGTRIGIGTTSPLNRVLHLYSNNSTSTGLRIQDGGTGGRSFSFVSTNNLSGLGGGRLTIYDDTAGESRLLIDNLGNIGIGTTTPDAKLQINTGANNRVGQIVRGHTNQSADLVQYQNSSGTVLSRIESDGVADMVAYKVDGVEGIDSTITVLDADGETEHELVFTKGILTGITTT